MKIEVFVEVFMWSLRFIVSVLSGAIEFCIFDNQKWDNREIDIHLKRFMFDNSDIVLIDLIT